MPKYNLKEPLILKNGTGFNLSPSNTELRADSAPNTEITIAINQAVESSSNVQFADLTANPFIIDNSTLVLNRNYISASGEVTQTGDFLVSSFVSHSGDFTVGGSVTAQTLEARLTRSFTLFESGSTLFGDTTDDTHQFSGSVVNSGSYTLNSSDTMTEISNDTSLTDGSSTSFVTENAVKTYIDDETDDFYTYIRKSYAHTGSFISISTASFTATTASAPSGITSTNEDDFMFFINGAIAENDALTVQQSGSIFYLKVNNNSIGYDLQNIDEIVAWGKFNS